jgi:hypothetical protein
MSTAVLTSNDQRDPRLDNCIVINKFDSKCKRCGHGAVPTETLHFTRIGYGDHDGIGCGTYFYYVMSDYPDLREVIEAAYPHLLWLE